MSATFFLDAAQQNQMSALEGDVPSNVEQEKLSPILKKYIADLASRESFGMDLVIDARTVMSSLDKHWPRPKFRGQEKQRQDILQYIKNLITHYPAEEVFPLFFLRIS